MATMGDKHSTWSHVAVESSFKRVLGDFNTATAAPDRFISPQVQLVSRFTALTKKLFDLSQQNPTDSNANLNIISELIVDNFDDEQIWQEIELLNDPSLKRSFKDVAKVIANRDGCSFFKRTRSKKSEVLPEQDSTTEGTDENIEELEYSGSQDLFPEMQTEEEDGDVEYKSDDSESDTNFDIDELEKCTKMAKKSKSSAPLRMAMSNMRTSEVDDKFFKLSEMERFLEIEDAREERRRQDEEGRGRKREEDDDDDDESIDYFQELTSGDDEELSDEDGDDNEENQNAKEMLYSDFYPAPDSAIGGITTQVEKKVRFKGIEDENVEGEEANVDDQEESSDEKDDKLDTTARNALSGMLRESDGSEGEEAMDIVGGKSNEANKSTFEKRQERLKEKIQQLEKGNLATKPWQLSGEITGTKRPANSLLEEDLDFEATAKPGVEITEETTKSLEDIIHQRVLDNAWDDVERKVKPKEDPYEFKKRVTLDQEKSKLSLAQIYEQEYIKKIQDEKEEEEDPAHVEIKTMMKSLFLKLDALSNFHYTPKPAIPEVKIVSNLPSISMEEVAPVTATDASLLAPEEIHEKHQGDVKGDTEKTETDKNQARRKKKSKQRVRAREKAKRQNLIDKLNPGLGNKYSKKAAMDKLVKSSKLASSKTTIIKEGKGSKKSLTSSKSFFTQLQEEVNAEVHGLAGSKNKKYDKKKVSSAKLKL